MLGKTAHQFYYTSCKIGLSGYAGFQTRAESTGLALEDRRELERKSGYQPPRDTERATEAGGDLLAEACPQSYKVIQLASGRTAVLQISYSGEDYSGRFGNYFAHGLVFDGRPGDSWPVDLFAWPRWVKALNEAEADKDPEPLPMISLDELAIGDDFGFPELQDFLSEDASRRDDLAKMVSSVFAGASDGRKLLIREVSAVGAMYWVACVLKAFPRTCQAGLTCSTFQFDPRGTLAINATLGETDFLFDEGERKYQFYVFDFLTQNHSALDVETHEYPSTVASWMASDPERLLRFHDFAEHFTLSEADDRLKHVLRLFRIQDGEELQLPESDINEMLDFVATFGTPVAVRLVLQESTAFLAALAKAPVEIWVRSFKRLIGFAATKPDPAVASSFAMAWLEGLHHFVFSELSAPQPLFSLRKTLLESISDTEHLLAISTSLPEQLDRIVDAVPNLDAPRLEAAMAQVLWASMQTGSWPSLQGTPARQLIEAAISVADPTTFTWAMRPVHQSPKNLCHMIELIVSIIKDSIADKEIDAAYGADLQMKLGQDFADLFSETLSQNQLSVIGFLLQDSNFNEVIFGDWQRGLEASQDKMAWHLKYESAVFGQPSNYQKWALPRTINHLHSVLSSKEFREQMCRWVISHRTKQMSKKNAEYVLQVAMKTVTFDPQDTHSDEIASIIEKEILERKMSISSGRAALRIYTRSAIKAEKLPASASAAIKQVDQSTYFEFMLPILSQRLEQVSDIKGYKNAIIPLINYGRAGDFLQIYLLHMKNRSTSERLDAFELAEIGFWLNFDKSDKACSDLEAIEIGARKALFLKIRVANPKTMKKALTFIRRLPNDPNAEIKGNWIMSLETLSAERGSWIQKIITLGKRQ